MNAIQSIQHVSLCIKDLSASRHFYTEILGLTELYRPDYFRVKGIWYQLGALQLHLIVNESLKIEQTQSSNTPHFAVYVPDEKYHDFIKHLKTNGVHFLEEPVLRQHDQVWQTFIFDPDHNVIELINTKPL